MAQRVNHFWNNIFINLPPLPLLCEISGVLHIVQLGLTAGRLAGRQNTGEYRNFRSGQYVKIFDLLLRLTKVQHHYRLSNAFQLAFWVKPIARLIFKAQNFLEAIRFLTNPYY